MQRSELESLNGEKLTLALDSGLRSLTVNGHEIIETNILANNGVIHVVDGLLSDNQEVDPLELENCLFLKAFEESRGNDYGVECSCNTVGGSAVLTCTESTTGTCSPRYGECNMEQPCCTPMRRCVSGQCRDSSRPERVKLSGSQGGAAGRVPRGRSSLGDNPRL